MRRFARHAACTSCLAAAIALGCAEAPSARRVTLVAARGSPLAVPANCVAVADCNADRHADLILTAGTRLQTHFGDGTGRFRAEPDRQVDMGEAASEIAVADVDGDGRPDVATAHHDQYTVAVFLGNADGGFRPAAGSPFRPKRGDHPHTHGLLLADLNGDGTPDLVTPSSAGWLPFRCSKTGSSSECGTTAVTVIASEQVRVTVEAGTGLDKSVRGASLSDERRFSASAVGEWQPTATADKLVEHGR